MICFLEHGVVITISHPSLRCMLQLVAATVVFMCRFCSRSARPVLTVSTRTNARRVLRGRRRARLPVSSVHWVAHVRAPAQRTPPDMLRSPVCVSGCAAGGQMGNTPKFWIVGELSEKIFFSSENFLSKNAIFGLKTPYFGDLLGAKIKLWALIIFRVRNLQQSVWII